MDENKCYSECSVNGICSINNAISSLHELVLLHIKTLAFYILKLKDFGITNDTIKLEVVDILYGIFINAGYSQSEYEDVIGKLDKFIYQAMYLYEKHCKENGIEIEKPGKKLKKNYNLVDAIKKGEKTFLKKYKSLTPEQKNTYEIIYFLCKSIIIRYVELQRLGCDYKDAYYITLAVLNACDSCGFCFDNVKDLFDECINVYFELVKMIFATQKRLYGKVQEAKVDMSSYEGKSILVSGSDLKALKTILELTEKSNINIYTHGFDLLVAHTLPEILKHKNLKGHFSVNKNNYIADFSKFPGPILMSKVYMENIDFLYRGRIFSQDPFVSKGVEKIINDDFSKLISSASLSKGFKKYNKRSTISAGYFENEILEFTDNILEKLKNNKLNNLYVIGICNCEQKNPYYEELLNNLPEKSFVFSFSYKKNGKNIFHINSFYDGRLFLKIFRNPNMIKNQNISVFMTSGDRYTVANLLLVKHLGFKHVFSDNFSDNVISPHTRQILSEKFNINFISDPRSDIAKSV